MAVSFTILKGTNIPKEWGRRPVNPYCLVEYKDVKLQTRVLSVAANHEWNETLEIDLMGKPLDHFGVVLLYLKDHCAYGIDRIIGQAVIPVRTIITKRQATLNVNLGDDCQRPTSMLISMIVRYEPPSFTRDSVLLRHSVYERRSYASSRRSSLSSLNSSTIIAPVTAAAAAAAPSLPESSEVQDLSAVSDAVVQTDETDEFGVADVAAQQSLRARSLSTVPQDFQVRVKVVCAKKLEGADVYPLCKITLLGQQRQTRVRRSTNTPVWNEVFNFTTRMTTADLVHESICFEVFDSRTLRRDSFVGCFRSELSVIYSREQHSAINKWLVLTDRDDGNCSVKGYLMVCVCVLEPGDSAPTFSQTTAAEDDVEANLLVPEGFSLQPATLSLRIYKGEDLPKLDLAFLESVRRLYNLVSSPSSDGVDPYVTAAYAGKKVRTKIAFASKNPVWNQELMLAFKFPSVTDNLQISIIDWNQVFEDVLCTRRLSTASISRTGSNGFLPTMGPCYINFYSSTCEGAKAEDKTVDGDCVGYRGRLFLELSTKLEAVSGQQVVDIAQDEVLRVEKYMKRHKYMLYATFLNATMLSKNSDAVQFGISIGPYGNEASGSYNEPRVASVTSPANAHFDNCEYYYVPWDDNKPCIALGCQWEDVSFRTDAMNMLISIACLMDDGIRALRIALKAKIGDEEIGELCRIVVNNIVRECCASVPRPTEEQASNELDEHLYNIRYDELKAIAEEAARLKVSNASAEHILHAIEQFLKIVNDLIRDPQSSIPDVFVWMVVDGARHAYARIPAHELLYSERGYSGRKCGKTQTLLLESISSVSPVGERAPAKVQVNIWLGKYEQEVQWRNNLKATISVVAEVYENQALFAGKWHSNTSVMQQRYPWSDESGTVELQKAKFQPPSGWVWDGEWSVVNAASTSTSPEVPEQYVEETFEVQCRNNDSDGSDWLPDIMWVDADNSTGLPKENIPLPDGWIWLNDWSVNQEKDVDEHGWEYSERLNDGVFGPTFKSEHLFRRRHWRRTRSRGVPSEPSMGVAEVAHLSENSAIPTPGGWEYAASFKDKFHREQLPTDSVRRRRWRRFLSSFDGSSTISFVSSQGPDGKMLVRQSSILSKKPDIPPAPRVYARMTGSVVYQLKAYVYQARDLPACNDNGLSDPYVIVCFDMQSQRTEVQKKSLSPIWDQTLVFNPARLWGSEADIAAQPPDVCIEVYSDDLLGRRKFLGQAQVQPKVKPSSTEAESRPTVLEWITLFRGQTSCGELLASFEIFQTAESQEAIVASSGPTAGITTTAAERLPVPVGVRPVLQRMAIEVLAWGVRNLKSHQLLLVNSPCIQVEVGGLCVCSSVIANAKVNPNFVPPFIFIETMLPQEPYFMPPINVRMYDQRSFGIRPVVGTHVIKNIDRYRVATPAPRANGEDDSSKNLQDKRKGVSVGPSFFSMSTRSSSVEAFETSESSSTFTTDWNDATEDWWSKYYASLSEAGDESLRKYQPLGPDTLKIYHCELEKAENFNEFTDFCETFPLVSCTGGLSSTSDEYEVVGELKGTFRVYALPEDRTKPLPPRILRDLPSSERQECVVRLYVVSATDLQPGLRSGLANPYLIVELGKQKFDTRDAHLINTLNPTFGKMFEFNATIPLEKDLRITVMDYDAINFDDPIGQTTIDLEDRLFTRHRGTCALPKYYYTAGPHVWRDSQRPTQILRHVCYLRGLSSPEYSGAAAVQVGNRMYFLSDFEAGQGRRPHQGSPKERLALHVLNTMDLVKEHVETRSLYNPLQRSFERGKLQCWVDIFPRQNGEPGPAWSITPRLPRPFYLRCIVWSVTDIPPAARGFLTERSRDVYVKGWFAGSEPQKTDVHYRTADGTGTFNWRFVFPFQYLPIEQLVVTNAKEKVWPLKDKQEKLKPTLTLQLWDNDLIAAGDCLGTVTLDLLQLPKPSKGRKLCDLRILPEFDSNATILSLFEQKRVRGFWPCYVIKNGVSQMTGKCELELEVLTAAQAAERPAGLGRADPNINPYLEPPRRPDSSFFWLASPIKTAKHIMWQQNKRGSI